MRRMLNRRVVCRGDSGRYPERSHPVVNRRLDGDVTQTLTWMIWEQARVWYGWYKPWRCVCETS